VRKRIKRSSLFPIIISFTVAIPLVIEDLSSDEAIACMAVITAMLICVMAWLDKRPGKKPRSHT